MNVFVYCDVKMNNLKEEKIKCSRLLQYYLESNITEVACPPEFDGRYCWPSTPSLTQAEIPCPFPKRQNGTMTRWCTANITEISSSLFNITVSQWSPAQYGDCLFLRGRVANIVYLFTLALRDADIGDADLSWWHEKLSILDQIGYGVSIISLIIALSIFTAFTKLQDTRVKVHINLFTAMLLQSLMSLSQNFFYGCRIYLTILLGLDGYNQKSSKYCRALMTLSHYFELTIFTWLLIEGWYFYSYISRAPYKEYLTIIPHMLVGWGLPLLVIIPWIVVHVYSTQTNFCWIDVDLKINIVAIPILLIVLVNLCFFVLNVRIIFIKMKSTFMSQKRMDYWRWIKSSLMLVPLFGTYDVLYGIWPWIENQQVKLAFLFIVRVICSFQGFVVAALHCFSNGEVKREINRAWNIWKVKREIQSEISRHHSSETLNKVRFNTLNKNNSKAELKNLDFNTYF